MREFTNPLELEEFYVRVIRNKKILYKKIKTFYNQQKDKITYVLHLELIDIV
jgi:hypothetical protein